MTLTLEGIGSAITLPFEKGYHGIQSGVKKFWAGFTELSDVKKKLQKTQTKLQKYEALTEEFSEIRRENIRLRRLLGLKARVVYASIPASIISKDPDNWFKTIIINKGENDGIKVNMPVVAFQGDLKAVVGKVIEVQGSVSRIIPIISPDMRMGVRFEQNRYPGLQKGIVSRSDVCIVDFVSRSAVVKKDDLVITSGQGGIFPAGLKVGRVVKSQILKSSAHQRVFIEPIINYNLIEEVYVIKKEPEKELLQLLKEKK